MPHSDLNTNIHSMDEFVAMDRRVEVLIVDSNACNDPSITHLDVSSFKGLRVFTVGDYSFAYVGEVNLVELEKLERVVIGEHCFMKKKRYDEPKHFYLKSCEKVKELKIGCYSFSGCSACEIENDDSLEMIEIGELNEMSRNSCYDIGFGNSNFYEGDCEIRSYCNGMN